MALGAHALCVGSEPAYACKHAHRAWAKYAVKVKVLITSSSFTARFLTHSQTWTVNLSQFLLRNQSRRESCNGSLPSTGRVCQAESSSEEQARLAALQDLACIYALMPVGKLDVAVVGVSTAEPVPCRRRR